jgi:hypothetical protein
VSIQNNGEARHRIGKYLRLFFRAGRNKNYAIERILDWTDIHYLLSPRLAHSSLHDRSINEKGRRGCNKPAGMTGLHLREPSALLVEVPPTSYTHCGPMSQISSVSTATDSYAKPLHPVVTTEKPK